MSTEPDDLLSKLGGLSLKDIDTNNSKDKKSRLSNLNQVDVKDKHQAGFQDLKLKNASVAEVHQRNENRLNSTEKKLDQRSSNFEPADKATHKNDRTKSEKDIPGNFKSISNLKNSKLSSYNNNQLQNNSNRVVTTFRSNVYASLGRHKKVESSNAKTIITPKNTESPRENIQVHDRWAHYSKTNNPTFVVANSRNKDASGFDEGILNEKSASKSLMINLTNKDENSFIEEEIKPEDCIIRGLEVALLPHQVSGLRFLKRREEIQGKFKGSLLCDDMGLGKTIQTIALMLENRNKDSSSHKTNLIICPVSLTTQWKAEIESKASGLSAMIYHGTDRPKDYETLLEYDVIITTYATVSSEFSKKGALSVLYSSKFTWWRIILDEAHQIKNKNSKQAHAMFNLRTNRRLCLTGTPLQNNLGELQSLFKFIRVSRYADDREWSSTIQESIQERDMTSALIDLRAELSKLMLRRTKNVLKSTNTTFKLPPKNIHKIRVEFSEFERSIYENVKEIILSNLNKERAKKDIKNEKNRSREDITSSIQLKTQISEKKSRNVNYLSALVYLLRLRQICCSWRLLFDENTDDLELDGTFSESNEDDSSIDSLIENMDNLSVKAKNCEICMVRLDLRNVPAGIGQFCSNCDKQVRIPMKEKNRESYSLSAKIKQVLKIVSSEGERKTIIFSQFPSLFPELKKNLETKGFKVLTYDGSMNVQARSLTLNSLKNDPKFNILLCSLKCGSVGLNLTCASRVILLDPWWNPQIQEQAVDRVYRIGQTKPVDIYEFTVKDTVEENILRLQERKRQLANAVTSNSNTNDTNMESKLSKDELLQLLGVDRRQNT